MNFMNRGKILRPIFLLITILILFLSCQKTIDENVSTVGTLKFVHPVRDYSYDDKTENILAELRIINKEDSTFEGILKFETSNNNMWRFVKGRYLKNDSLSFKDIQSILSSPHPPGDLKIWDASYKLSIKDSIVRGQIKVNPGKSPFYKAPDSILVITGRYYKNGVALSQFEKDAWKLFQKEKGEKHKYSRLADEYSAIAYDNAKRIDNMEKIDSLRNILGTLSIHLFKSGYTFFQSYSDSLRAQIEFRGRIRGWGRFATNSENQIKEFRSYMSKIQPEGSRFFLEWNDLAGSAEARNAWALLKAQDKIEFQGQKTTKKIIRNKNLSRGKAFYLSVNPSLLHSSEKLNFLYMYAHRVIQYDPSYADTIYKLIDKFSQEKPKNEEHQWHINRILDVVDKYIEGTKVNPGSMAPNFKLAALDGQVIDFSKYRGKVVYLEFWTTWCGPCKAATPNLKKIHEKYNQMEFQIIGVAPDKEKAVIDYCQENEIRWPQIIPNEKDKYDIEKLYGVAGFPTGFLIDKSGKIIERIHPNDKRLDQKINALL